MGYVLRLNSVLQYDIIVYRAAAKQSGFPPSEFGRLSHQFLAIDPGCLPHRHKGTAGLQLSPSLSAAIRMEGNFKAVMIYWTA